ncbi:uncharacterized protein LOC124686521 [Lolium rigidum]|uniref:uncharacterized protein LOC124686521 n=1 Tax=Lolium rigidum TaxID=89674 RepID=UPI001F5CF563|nr:uncharacterized protein LOC124686521 [Lolium rigidum]XP_047076406.1 uncharacterized protein LOC124686521 [Lolium rigidum]
MATKEDFDNLHNMVRRYVVKIRSSGAIRGRGWSVVTPGIVFLKEDSFCYIVAHANTFSHGHDCDPQPRYEVVFPDSNRTTIEFQKADVQFCRYIAAFLIVNVHLENDMVQAVPFSSFGLEAEEAVYTLCLDPSETTIPKPSYLSPGLINVVGGRYFTQDCRPENFTSWGSPVFDDEGHLVGICFAHCSVLLALDVLGISLVLNELHGTSQKPIHDILDYIKVKAHKLMINLS